MFLNNPLGACLLVTALGFGVLPVASAQSATQVIDGTWWMSFGPALPQRPLILTLARSGAFTLVDSTDGGGHLPTGAKFSPTHGSWTRSGPFSAQALGLRFVYDALGKTKAVERVRISLSFKDSFDRIEGELRLEEMSCEEKPSPPLPFLIPICPDPATAPTQVLRGPAPFTAVRVGVYAAAI